MARRRKGDPVHGWVVLDKPLGVTSTQAVGRVRRVFNAQKAGHGGTLDPLASGLLPIALGEATKTVPQAMGGQKTYRFTVKWGEATTTDDQEGEVIARSPHRPDSAAINAALPKFIGEIAQMPPQFSALKVNGARAYDLARKGKKVDLAARVISIEALTLVEQLDQDHAIFEVMCGKGTYVRSLARDLGEVLGTVAHVRDLRRTQVGSFYEKHAISLDKLESLSHSAAAFEHLFPVSTVLDDIPALAVSAREAQRLRNGHAISLSRGQTEQACGADKAFAAYGVQAIALGDIKAGQFHPTRVFNLPLKGRHDVDYD